MFYCKINNFQCNIHTFLGSLLGTSPSMLQTVVTGGGCQSCPAIDPPPSFVIDPPTMVTTVPAQTTVMDPPMMAPTILSVLFAVAVIKALILGKFGKTPMKFSNLYIPRELIAFVKLLSQDLTEVEINIFG